MTVVLSLGLISYELIRLRIYWSAREVHWVEGKIRVRWQKYLGTRENPSAEPRGSPICARQNNGVLRGQS